MKRHGGRRDDLLTLGLGGASSFSWMESAVQERRQQRRQQQQHDDDVGGDDNEDGELPPLTAEGLGLDNNLEQEGGGERDIYEPCLLKSRKRERKRLGKPDARSTCFFCVYVGEKDTLLPESDVNKMIEMMRENTGRMEMETLAQMIADYYALFRSRINGSLRQGEQPLPHMSAATVVEHIRKHHQDPEVKQIVVLEELQELRESILESVMEKSSIKKHKRANKVQIDCLEKVIKLELIVQSKDPAKMALYSAGARLNPTTHRQGPVAGTSKNLFSYWENRN